MNSTYTSSTTVLSEEHTSWHMYIIYGNGLLSYIANSVLIYFILRHSRKDMGTYKILMLLFAIFDIIYPTCHVIVLPNMHVHRRAFVIFPTGILNHQMEGGHWEIIGYVSLYCLATVLLAYHFIYRYLLVCKNHMMYIFNNVEYVPILFTIWIFAGALWGIAVHTTMYHTPILKEYVREALMNEYVVDVERVPVVGPLYFLDDPSGGIAPYWPGCIGSAACIPLLSLSFSIIIFCTYQTFATLKQCTMSKNGKRLQYDLLKALLMQTFVPLVCEYLPCAITFTSPFVGIPLGKYTNLVPIAISFYPVLDPLCLLYFVKDYRFAILRIFRRESVIDPYKTTTGDFSKSGRTIEASIGNSEQRGV